jgi:hypothetical protein
MLDQPCFGAAGAGCAAGRHQPAIAALIATEKFGARLNVCSVNGPQNAMSRE